MEKFKPPSAVRRFVEKNVNTFLFGDFRHVRDFDRMRELEEKLTKEKKHLIATDYMDRNGVFRKCADAQDCKNMSHFKNVILVMEEEIAELKAKLGKK